MPGCPGGIFPEIETPGNVIKYGGSIMTGISSTSTLAQMKITVTNDYFVFDAATLAWRRRVPYCQRGGSACFTPAPILNSKYSNRVLPPLTEHVMHVTQSVKLFQIPVFVIIGGFSAYNGNNPFPNSNTYNENLFFSLDNGVSWFSR
jgi:hypothetical protein